MQQVFGKTCIVLCPDCRALLQASNLGFLSLRPFNTQIEGAQDVSSPDMLMPWQMAQASLNNPIGGPVEPCLLPLGLFKDTAELASAAACPNAAAHAFSDAHTCLDALMKPLAQQVCAS